MNPTESGNSLNSIRQPFQELQTLVHDCLRRSTAEQGKIDRINSLFQQIEQTLSGASSTQAPLQKVG